MLVWVTFVQTYINRWRPPLEQRSLCSVQSYAVIVWPKRTLRIQRQHTQQISVASYYANCGLEYKIVRDKRLLRNVHRKAGQARSKTTETEPFFLLSDSFHNWTSDCWEMKKVELDKIFVTNVETGPIFLVSKSPLAHCSTVWTFLGMMASRPVHVLVAELSGTRASLVAVKLKLNSESSPLNTKECKTATPNLTFRTFANAETRLNSWPLIQTITRSLSLIQTLALLY